MNKINLTPNVNQEKGNIFNFSFPLKILSRNNSSGEIKKNMVVFLGNGFRNLPAIDFRQIIKSTNKCLDYIRRECAGYELYYKPHPAETDEYYFLNLEGFKIMERAPVELVFMKYSGSIHHVFSTFSTASRIAYEFGLNSSVFLNLFVSAIDRKSFDSFSKFLSILPEECFINDLSESVRENKKITGSGSEPEERLQKLITGRHGKVWMLIGDPNSLPYAKVIDTLVKKHNPEMRMHLVVDRHHRWEMIPLDEVGKMFDAVSYVPRVFYSLRPNKILRAFRTARVIRRWPISKDDVIISRYGLSFMDDCFASYFPQNKRIALMPKDFFDLSCGEMDLSPPRYRRRPGAVFFNRILEPLLGIERTEYLENKQRAGWNIFRYKRPLNDIFDEVWTY